ncbi:MAG: FAD-binding oxidoreductase, partial [Alphaproteobacteria bacterium]
IGPLGEGAYLAVMHSGATLAPLVGELVAAEIGGRECAELAAFRPARFL